MASVTTDPTRIADLADLAGLAEELMKLRRRAAKKGQVQLSVRDIATKINRASSTLDPYLRGVRLCPYDVYEDVLRALAVPADQLLPWLEAWERVASGGARAHVARPRSGAARRPALSGGDESTAGGAPGRSSIIPHNETFIYRVKQLGPAGAAKVAITTGDLRRIRFADVWVNSENTNMIMPRFEENSISAIIRFAGARKDAAGRVIGDDIADELAARVAGTTPVVAGTAITTGSGELAASNNVRYLTHVAAVQGEPGEGYRQIADVGSCATNALAAAERLGGPAAPVRTILFPILGTGVARAAVRPTVQVILGAIIDHLTSRAEHRVRVVYVLATTREDLEIAQSIFDAHPRLTGLLVSA